MKLFKKTILFALVSCAISTGWAYEARVVGVSDGDTVTVLDATKVQHKIRVAGIDAPEKAQDFGNRSKEHLSDLVFSKTVSIPDVKVDKYGRTVSRIIVNGTDAGLEQIKAGLAWHYKQYEIEQSPADRASYSAAELKARAAKLGLWAQGIPVRPQDFRHGGDTPTMVKAIGSGAECPCGTNNFCTGSRGGQYCLSGSGHKKYASR